MEIYILNQSYEKIGVLDNYKSLIWSKRYVEFGDFEIYAPANNLSMSLLQIGNYVTRSDDDMICRINKFALNTDAENGDFITVTGYDCKKILNQRIVWKQTNFKGQAGAFVTKLINENIINPTDNARQISNFTLGTFTGFDDLIEMQTTYDNVGDKINEICKLFKYGSKVTFNGTNFVFDLYKGIDRSFAQSINPYVVFSKNFDNLKTTNYEADAEKFASIALVGGEGEGNKQYLTTVQSNNQIGVNRYEIFVDAKSTSKDISYDELLELYPDGTLSTVGGTIYYVIGEYRYAYLDDALNPVNAILITTHETITYVDLVARYPGGTIYIDGDYTIYYKVEGVNIAIVDNLYEPTNAILEDNPYYNLLKNDGNEKLAEYHVITAFDGEIENNSYIYKTDYYLGDIVQIKTDYGIEKRVRIIEVIESFDDNGYSIIPTYEYEAII